LFALNGSLLAGVPSFAERLPLGDGGLSIDFGGLLDIGGGGIERLSGGLRLCGEGGEGGCWRIRGCGRICGCWRIRSFGRGPRGCCIARVCVCL
jgi:hypothetical protein